MNELLKINKAIIAGVSAAVTAYAALDGFDSLGRLAGAIAVGAVVGFAVWRVPNAKAA